MAIEKRAAAQAAAGVGIMFASNGVIFAALLPWYPLIAARLNLSPVEFGFIVASFAVGALLSSAVPAPLVARFGPARVAVAGTVLLAIAIASAAWMNTGWAFALCVFLAGFFDAIVDVAQNVAGIRVQDRISRPILSSMHALWSLGGLLGAAVATAVAATGALDIRAHLALVAVACVALVTLGALTSRRLAQAPPAAPVDPVKGNSGRKLWRIVFLAAAPLVVIAICGTMVEDVGNNWAAMAGVQIGGIAPEVAGIAFSVMIGSQCIGRFSGDLLIKRFGGSAVARTGGLLVALGGALIVATSGNLWLVLAGFALAGYGSATLVPSALSAAAKIPGVSEGAGVTIVSWLMRVGLLITSPIIGTITNSAGLRWGLAVLLLVGVAAMVFASSLRERGSQAQ